MVGEAGGLVVVEVVNMGLVGRMVLMEVEGLVVVRSDVVEIGICKLVVMRRVEVVVEIGRGN